MSLLENVSMKQFASLVEQAADIHEKSFVPGPATQYSVVVNYTTGTYSINVYAAAQQVVTEMYGSRYTTEEMDPLADLIAVSLSAMWNDILGWAKRNK